MPSRGSTPPYRGGRETLPSYRGRRGRRGEIIRHGNKTLVQKDISGIHSHPKMTNEENELFKQLLEFKKLQPTLSDKKDES